MCCKNEYFKICVVVISKQMAMQANQSFGMTLNITYTDSNLLMMQITNL